MAACWSGADAWRVVKWALTSPAVCEALQSKAKGMKARTGTLVPTFYTYVHTIVTGHILRGTYSAQVSAAAAMPVVQRHCSQSCRRDSWQVSMISDMPHSRGHS